MAESVISQGTGGATVDPDHPWLGLHPFTEENQHYFFGRTAEIREIFLRVRENPLTVLYGNSGLGKTSLVRAGLIPKLRVERFRPVHLLLDFSSASPSLTDQVREALAKVCADPDSDAATLLERWAPLGSLWEIYAHEKLRPPEIAARPPVLIFDQFEEVFTLGRDEAGTANRRNAEVTELFTQIADLVENRAPAKLQALFRDEPQRALDYDFGTTVARVVLALREDFLAQFEQWKSVMPSLMRNRMPLRLLTGPQALEAVVRPGRMDGLSLVSDQVGEQIVRFVAQRPDDTPLEQIEAVPPLVSLVCERLNAARLEAKPPDKEISDELVKSQGADILQRFYDESFAAFRDGEREAVREYIEERMVTVGGHRNPVAREDAVAELARRGISAPDSVLDALIARRLLTPEQRGGIQRLEITHDVLAPLVVRGRKEREERHLTREAERRTEEAKRKQAEAEALAATERRHRRWLGIALGFVSALLLLAVGALWFAFLEKNQADKAAALAEEQARTADGLINFMLDDLRDKLQPIGRLDVLQDVAKRAKEYLESLPKELVTASRLKQQIIMLNNLGDVRVAQGKLQDAQDVYQQSLAIAKRLAEQDKSNSEWQRLLSLSYNNLGDVRVAQGKLQDALDLYRRSLKIGQTLAEQDKSNAGSQRDLAASYERVGNVRVAQGKLQDALDLYQQSLKIRQTLVEQDKSNADWQRDLALIYISVGDVLVAQGKIQNALGAYQQTLAIDQRLTEQDKSNAGWQRDLSVSYEKVGDVLVAQGKLQDALDLYQQELTIFKRLAEQDKSNAGWQRGLSASYEKVGDVLVPQGKLQDALDVYQRSLKIGQTLAEQDKSNAGWQRDLAVSCEKVGDVLVPQGKLQDALDAYQQTLAIDQRLAEQDKSNAGWQRDLALIYVRVGNVRVAQGKSQDALDAYQQTLAIDQRLAEQDKSNAGWQRDLSVSYEKVGDVLVAQGKLQDALDAYQQPLAIDQRLAEQDKSNAGWQRDLAVIYERVGNVRVAQGNLQDGLDLYQQQLTIFKRLADQDKSNAGSQRDLAVIYERVGSVRVAQGKLQDALDLYQQELTIFKRLADQDKSNAGSQRDLSISSQKVGDVLAAHGKLQDALDLYQQELTISKRLADQDKSNAGWQIDLSISSQKVGDVLAAQGDLADALKNYRDAFAIAEKMASQDPSNAIRQNGAAWGRYCVAKVLIRIKDGDRNEARRLVIEGIDIMTRLEHQGTLDTNAQDTLNKLNEIADVLTSSSSGY